MTDDTLTLDPIKSKADLLRYLKNRVEEAKREADLQESQGCAEERHLARCLVNTLQRTYDDIASACVSWSATKGLTTVLYFHGKPEEPVTND